jgi:N-methylhydantoinase B
MARNGNGVDPFTLEIISESLRAIGDEMFVTMQRTSMSVIIYETLDYATGLTDAQGRLITQGNGVTLFLGTLDYGVRSVLEKFGYDGLKPGDIVITNDPYGGGGTHLSDVSLIMPIFYDGKIVAFAANKGHWTEVGGMAAGSWTTDSTEIYQEGLQFPVIKIFEEGKINQGLVDLIRANVRTPDMSIGDMMAQAASLRIAERRFRELCDKYGVETVTAGIEKLMNDSETLIRQELRKIPPGVYEAEDYIDDDGISEGPFKVQVKVTVTPDKLICDYTGSHPQVLGPVNAGWTALVAAARAIFLALTDPSIPTNDGCFRPLEIICPPRTIFTAERPAAVSTYWETMLYAADLIWKAMRRCCPIGCRQATSSAYVLRSSPACIPTRARCSSWWSRARAAGVPAQPKTARTACSAWGTARPTMCRWKYVSSVMACWSNSMPTTSPRGGQASSEAGVAWCAIIASWPTAPSIPAPSDVSNSCPGAWRVAALDLATT